MNVDSEQRDDERGGGINAAPEKLDNQQQVWGVADRRGGHATGQVATREITQLLTHTPSTTAYVVFLA